MSAYLAWEVSPKSATLFTVLNTTTHEAQEWDLTRLNERGLHKALFILKRKVDPQALRDLYTLWKGLPPIGDKFDLDVDLQKKMSADALKEELEKFLAAWSMQTRDMRKLDPPINADKFATTTNWEQLHTVTVPATNPQLSVSAMGIVLRPEECAKEIAQLRREMDDIRDTLERCNTYTVGSPEQQTCMALLKDKLTEAQTRQTTSRCA